MQDFLQPPAPRKSRIPYSFWIMVAVIGVVAIGVLMNVFFAMIHAPIRYFAATAFPILIGASLLSSGVYAGFTYHSDERRHRLLNKIGLWGNSILFGVMIFGLCAFTVNRMV